MNQTLRGVLLYAVMALLIVAVGVFQSWTLALAILNLCLISAVMALGVNIQWGYAGLFNVGIMGFAALGGIGAVLVSMPPVPAGSTASVRTYDTWASSTARWRRSGSRRRPSSSTRRGCTTTPRA